jgi:hypothetical protein
MQGAITLNQSIMQPLVRSWRASDTHCGDGDRDAALKKRSMAAQQQSPTGRAELGKYIIHTQPRGTTLRTSRSEIIARVLTSLKMTSD